MNHGKALSEHDKAARRRTIKKNLIAYSFIAPNFIGFCVITLVPMFFALVLAFFEWDGVHQMQFLGFGNFRRLFQDRMFKAAFVNTIVYSAVTVPVTMVFSLAMALLLNQNVKGRNFFRTLGFFPYVASLVAVAAVWNFIFNPSMGPVNMMLSRLGVENPPRWAAGKNTAMLTVIMFSVWKNMGYYMVIYLAGLQGINQELYEAAQLDGANTWQLFRHVTLPQLRPTTFFVVVMLTIASFKVYDQVYMITEGGPGTATLTLVYHVYNEAFVGSPEFGYASSIALVLLVLVLAITMVQFRGSTGTAE